MDRLSALGQFVYTMRAKREHSLLLIYKKPDNWTAVDCNVINIKKPLLFTTELHYTKYARNFFVGTSIKI